MRLLETKILSIKTSKKKKVKNNIEKESDDDLDYLLSDTFQYVGTKHDIFYDDNDCIKTTFIPNKKVDDSVYLFTKQIELQKDQIEEFKKESNNYNKDVVSILQHPTNTNIFYLCAIKKVTPKGERFFKKRRNLIIKPKIIVRKKRRKLNNDDEDKKRMQYVKTAFNFKVLQSCKDFFDYGKQRIKKIVSKNLDKRTKFLNDNIIKLFSIIGNTDVKYNLLFGSDKVRFDFIKNELKREQKTNPTSKLTIWYENTRRKDLSKFGSALPPEFVEFQEKIATMLMNLLKEYYNKHKKVVQQQGLDLF